MNIIKEKERLNKLINSSDLDERIEGKRKAKELGFAVIPTSNGYEVIPTKHMLMKFYDEGRTDLIQEMDQRD